MEQCEFKFPCVDILGYAGIAVDDVLVEWQRGQAFDIPAHSILLIRKHIRSRNEDSVDFTWMHRMVMDFIGLMLRNPHLAYSVYGTLT